MGSNIFAFISSKIDEDLRALGGDAMEKMTNAQW